MDDEVFSIKLSDLAEPPLIENGYEFLMLIPRKQAPNGWQKVLDEHGLNRHLQHTPRGLMLSFTTTNYVECENVSKRFLRMPWADEIIEFWTRQYTNIRLTRHVDDHAKRASQLPDVTSPVALSRGVSHAPEIVEAHRAARRDAAAAKAQAERQQRQRHFAARAALAAKDQADYDEAVKNGETRPISEWIRTRPELPPFEEWQKAIEAGEEPQLLLSAGDVVEDAWQAKQRAEKLAKERDEAEVAAAAKAEKREAHAFRERTTQEVEQERQDYEKEMAAAGSEEDARERRRKAYEEIARKAYDDVRYFFTDASEPDQAYAFDDVVREVQVGFGQVYPAEATREALDRLISEGIIRKDEDGYRWIEEQADGRNS